MLLRALAPEASASTNSAISANLVQISNENFFFEPIDQSNSDSCPTKQSQPQQFFTRNARKCHNRWYDSTRTTFPQGSPVISEESLSTTSIIVRMEFYLSGAARFQRLNNSFHVFRSPPPTDKDAIRCLDDCNILHTNGRHQPITRAMHKNIF